MKKKLLCAVIFSIFVFLSQSLCAEETAKDYFYQGITYENQKVHGEAIKLFTKAIELDPRYAEAYFNRGKSYLSMDSVYDFEAFSDFNKAVTLDPANADIYYERGLLHAYVMNNEQAQKDMETAAALGHKDAKRWLDIVKNRGNIRYTDFGDFLAGGAEPTVLFDFDKKNIKFQYYALLDKIAELLKNKFPQMGVFVAGHADSIGTEKYNTTLSVERARVIKNYLTTRHGIDPKRFVVKGFGESKPLVENDSEANRALNRRVDMLGVENF